MFKSAKLLHYAHILFHQNITSYNLKILSKAKKSSKFVDIIAILDEKCRSHFNFSILICLSIWESVQKLFRELGAASVFSQRVQNIL